MNKPNTLGDYLVDADELLSSYHQVLIVSQDAALETVRAVQEVENLQREISDITRRMIDAKAPDAMGELLTDRAKQAAEQILHFIDSTEKGISTDHGHPVPNEAHLRELRRALIILGPPDELPPLPPSGDQGKGRPADQPIWPRAGK